MNVACFVRVAGAPLVALVICACETLPEGPFPRATEVGWWNDEGASGPARIIVHVGEQKAYFYKGEGLVGESTVSTGKPGFSTPPGSYSVLSKSPDHVSTIFGDYVDNDGMSWNQISTLGRIGVREAAISMAPKCRTPCSLEAVTQCIRDMYPPLRLPTAAFACRREWREHFTRMPPSAHQ